MLSSDEKIEFLNRVFTQEIFKKMMMGVFEKDRKLITYLITLRVLQAENFVDPNLSDFIIHGARNLRPDIKPPEELSDVSWVDGMMWAEILYLSKFKPFNQKNMVDHFVNQKQEWVDFFNTRDETLTFEELPNKELLDLRYFSRYGEDDYDNMESSHLHEA